MFCLPHAGAGASVYRDWPELLAPGIDAIPVQLPGRENLYLQPAVHSAERLAAELSEPLASRGGSDFALFGHSMGAVICYELAHLLSALGKPPRHLFVSGLGAPYLPPMQSASASGDGSRRRPGPAWGPEPPSTEGRPVADIVQRARTASHNR